MNKMGVVLITLITLFVSSVFAMEVPKEGVLPDPISKSVRPDTEIGSIAPVSTCDLDEEALTKGTIVIRFTVENMGNAVKAGISSFFHTCTFYNVLQK